MKQCARVCVCVCVRVCNSISLLDNSLTTRKKPYYFIVNEIKLRINNFSVKRGCLLSSSMKIWRNMSEFKCVQMDSFFIPHHIWGKLNKLKSPYDRRALC